MILFIVLFFIASVLSVVKVGDYTFLDSSEECPIGLNLTATVVNGATTVVPCLTSAKFRTVNSISIKWPSQQLMLNSKLVQGAITKTNFNATVFTNKLGFEFTSFLYRIYNIKMIQKGTETLKIDLSGNMSSVYIGNSTLQVWSFDCGAQDSFINTFSIKNTGFSATCYNSKAAARSSISYVSVTPVGSTFAINPISNVDQAPAGVKIYGTSSSALTSIRIVYDTVNSTRVLLNYDFGFTNIPNIFVNEDPNSLQMDYTHLFLSGGYLVY